MRLDNRYIMTILLLLILISVSIAPMMIAQNDPDDIYWDRGFGRQSGVSSYQAVFDMIIYNNLPISCGRLTLQVGNEESYNILAWDGIGYFSLDTGVSFFGQSMVIYNNKLVVGGQSTAGISIAEWDGSSWSSLDTGLTGTIEAMTVLHDSLFVAGWLQKDSNSYAWSVAVWDGSIWGKLDDNFNDSINALAVYNDQLIIGGDFTTIGLQNINVLARWSNNSWSSFIKSINIEKKEEDIQNILIPALILSESKSSELSNRCQIIIKKYDDRKSLKDLYREFQYRGFNLPWVRDHLSNKK